MERVTQIFRGRLPKQTPEILWTTPNSIGKSAAQRAAPKCRRRDRHHAGDAIDHAKMFFCARTHLEHVPFYRTPHCNEKIYLRIYTK